MVFSFQLAHFSKVVKHAIRYEMVTRFKSTSYCSCFPDNFWSSYEYVLHHQSEDSRAH